MNDFLKPIGTVVDHEGKELELLPGCEYRHYLLPIEYLPSRRYAPRWGSQVAPHAGLSRIFDRSRPTVEKTLSRLEELRPNFESIPVTFEPPAPGWVGGPMNAIDLALIYYFVGEYRPRRYVEIGSGVSTCFARFAAKSLKLSTDIISIDPEPRASIDSICDSVIREGFETLPDFKVFEALEPGDIVFMDGSHRTFMNSDVTVFIMDVIPLLKPGVLIHFHDICLPRDYPLAFANWYWNEQYMLAAYLLGADEKVEVLFPAYHVTHIDEYRRRLEGLSLPGTDPLSWVYGGSFWFTKNC